MADNHLCHRTVRFVLQFFGCVPYHQTSCSVGLECCKVILRTLHGMAGIARCATTSFVCHSVVCHVCLPACLPVRTLVGETRQIKKLARDRPTGNRVCNRSSLVRFEPTLTNTSGTTQAHHDLASTSASQLTQLAPSHVSDKEVRLFTIGTPARRALVHRPLPNVLKMPQNMLRHSECPPPPAPLLVLGSEPLPPRRWTLCQHESPLEHREAENRLQPRSKLDCLCRPTLNRRFPTIHATQRNAACSRTRICEHGSFHHCGWQ